MRIYVDGNEDGSKSQAGDIDYVDQNLFIGKCSYANAWQFNGIIDEVAIFNTVLSEGDITHRELGDRGNTI